MSDYTVAPPTKGDPITADWAAKICAAANAAQFTSEDADTLRTPNGATYAAPPPRDMGVPPPLPAPFTVRLLDDGEGELHAWVYAPSGYDANGEPYYVHLGRAPCVPNMSAAAWTTDGWWDLGEVEADGDPHYIVLGINDPTHSPMGFDVILQDSRRLTPDGCCPGFPPVVIARICIPDEQASGEDAEDPATPGQLTALSSDSGAYGVVQFVLGAINLSDIGTAPLDCAIGFVESNGSEVAHLFVNGAIEKTIRINGLEVVFDDGGRTPVMGFYDLGAVSNGSVVWLSFDVAPSTNTGRVTNESADVVCSVSMSDITNPPTPQNIGSGHERMSPPIPIWRGVGYWTDTVPRGIQLLRGTVSLTLTVPDKSNARTDGKVFSSLEWGADGQTQISGFQSGGASASGFASSTGSSFLVRMANSSGGAEVRYLAPTEVALASSGNIICGGDTYTPTLITYLDGNGVAQTITVLKKQ